MPVAVIAPVTGETPPALGSKRAAELGEHAESSFLAVVLELVRPRRDQLRQVARPQIGGGSRCGHGAQATHALACLALIRCCSFCRNLLASSIRGLSIRAVGAEA
jgi:hypothetical protein